MKKIITILCAGMLTLQAYAQAPNKFSYQAVVRDAKNNLVTNAPIGTKISLLQGSASGKSVYEEIHTSTTNANGLAAIEIGGGKVVSGDFSSINWAEGPYFIKTETDLAGGSQYSLTAISELLSVPFALYAANGNPGPQGPQGIQGIPGPQGIPGISAPQSLMAAGTSWDLLGNAGNTSTNFIGTTDAVDLIFKRNNVQVGKIDANNVFIGETAGLTNTALNNIGIGKSALKVSTNINNTAIGFRALEANTIGSDNSGAGTYVLQNNTSGRANTANGVYAMNFNTTGNYNVALGNQALFGNATGNANTAVGYNALSGSSAIDSSTAVGAYALYNNVSGTGNVAIGNNALKNNISGRNNNAHGMNALKSNTSGSYNNAFGNKALSSVTNTTGNNAFGDLALERNIGSGNTAFGDFSLRNIVAGINNTAIGSFAGSFTGTGVNNITCVGNNSGFATTLSNQVNVGNTSVTLIAGQVSWSTYSDKRIKNDVQEDVPGLAFITKLKPVTYHLDIKKQEKIGNAGAPKSDRADVDYPEKYDIEKIKMTGFLAQDVEAAAKSINYDFSGVVAPKDGKGLYTVRYSEFVMPLVKAIQEQQAIIEALTKRLELLEKK
jgi:trimeric autotransporter adhesin